MSSELNIVLIVLVILLAILCLYLLFFKKCNGGKNNPRVNTGGMPQGVPRASHEWDFTKASGENVSDTGIGKTEETSISLRGGCRLDSELGLVLDGQPGSYASSRLVYDICDPVSFEILFKYENRNQESQGGVFSLGKYSREQNFYDISANTGFITLQPVVFPPESFGHLMFQYSEAENRPDSRWRGRGEVITDQPVIDYDNWMHLVITIGNNGVKIYKNGQLIKHDPHVPGAQDGLDPPRAMDPASRDFWDCETIRANDFKRWLQIGKGFPTYGRSPDGSEDYWKGAIKHFRIWKGTELTELMVLQLL